MNRRDELDEMYVVLCKGCAGMSCMECPGREYQHCGDYNKAVKLYDAGWRKQVTAKWEVIAQYGGLHVRCSNADCHRHLPFGTSPGQFQYCPFCGAKMEGECR